MRRLAVAVFALAALAAVPSAEACDCGGCPPISCGTTSTTVAPGLLFVRNFGEQGQLDVFKVETGGHRFSLPPGRVSANGARYFTAARSHGSTVFRAYDARTGRVLHSWTHPGRDWSVSGVSANGGRIALLRPTRKLTSIELVDSERGRTLRRISLRGWFEVDAVPNDGRRLFLIQYVNRGYLIRRYDLSRRALASRSLTEKGVPMAGTAWDAVASRDGRWLLTLYLRGSNAAEVHTLDLVHGTAVCIDLPRGESTAIQQYALALGRDGRTLYAANPALGVVAKIDLRTKRVVHVDRFAGHPDPAWQSPNAAVSHDGRTIYFTAGRRLYAYDAAYGVVRGTYDPGAAVSGIAFSGDDHRLLVVRRDYRVVRFDAATGSRIR